MQNICEKKKDTSKFLVSFVGGIAGGFAVWYLSPILTGNQEAWDGNRLYYFSGIITCGILLSLYSPKFYWVVAAGVLVGQIAYGYFILQNRQIHILSLAFYLLTSLLALLSGLFVFMLQIIFKKLRANPAENFS